MFLKTLGIGGLGVGLAGVTAGPAVAFLTYPMSHATVSGGKGLQRVGKSAHFKPGRPVKVDLFADRRDAWNRILKVKVGSAWLLRQGERLRAWSTVCPHLGCAVDFDGDETKFKCPCHHSVFTLEGKVEGGPSPRAMDELEVEEKDGIVAIRYERYRQGSAAKEVVL